jgi:hypothetical protein
MLASTAGHLVDRITQRWVQFTGRTVDIAGEHRWLAGPTGEPEGIGRDYFQEFAHKHSLEIGPGAGLLDDFDMLRGPDFNPAEVARPVADFYQRTADYSLDAWSEWCNAFRPFGWLLALIFSRRLQQLNVPLSSLDTSRGVTSEVLRVSDPVSGQHRFTAWLRRLIGSGDVLYAGAYSTCRVPNYQGDCVKVVFPLPNGNAMVIMRPVAHADGSFSVVSHGERFGDPGFYFTVHSAKGVRARYLKTLRESIKVYCAEDGVVRADHVLSLWRLTFLRLHYRMVNKQAAPERRALVRTP